MSARYLKFANAIKEVGGFFFVSFFVLLLVIAVVGEAVAFSVVCTYPIHCDTLTRRLTGASLDLTRVSIFS